MDHDVYEMLAQDLVNNVGLEYLQALEIVDFLQNNDFIDYDTLKEIYIYDDED
jgi:hypothetical protein